MPYRIQEQSKETYLKVLESWLVNMPNMPDKFRDDTVADAYWEDPGTFWYQTPGGAFFWVSNLGEGCADFHALNTKGARMIRDPKQYHPVLREIFHDLKLRRLSAFIPKPLSAIVKAAQRIGFKHEGVVRKVVKFNGEYQDAEILGLLYSDIPKKEKRHRSRPGRKRRKRSKVNRTRQESRKAA